MPRFLVLFAETLSAFLGILMLGKIPRSDSGKWIFQGHCTASKKFPCWRRFGYTSSISKVQEKHDLRGFMDFFRFGCMSTGFVNEMWPSSNFSTFHFHFFPLQIQGLPFSSFFTFGWCYKSLTQIVLGSPQPWSGAVFQQPVRASCWSGAVVVVGPWNKAMTTIEFCEKSTQNQSFSETEIWGFRWWMVNGMYFHKQFVGKIRVWLGIFKVVEVKFGREHHWCFLLNSIFWRSKKTSRAKRCSEKRRSCAENCFLRWSTQCSKRWFLVKKSWMFKQTPSWYWYISYSQE